MLRGLRGLGLTVAEIGSLGPAPHRGLRLAALLDAAGARTTTRIRQPGEIGVGYDASGLRAAQRCLYAAAVLRAVHADRPYAVQRDSVRRAVS